jgi:DNA polymerase III subunit chi
MACACSTGLSPTTTKWFSSGAPVQVDFYQLSRDPVEQVLPAIARRILESGARLLVVDRREGALDRLSRALWEGEPASFLAHGSAGDEREASQPILLSTDTGAANALAFVRAFFFFDPATIDNARAAWRAIKGREGVEPRFWRQEGRRWVQGP